jgi:hypothetical protein
VVAPQVDQTAKPRIGGSVIVSESFLASRAFLVAATALPLLGYVASVGIAEARRAGAPRIQVAIEGYDPRDPVRGHYLMFRVKTEKTDEPRDTDPNFENSWMTYEEQACLGPEEEGVSVIYRYSGPPSPDCRQPLPADFVRDSHRFYVQQDAAPLLEKAVREERATVVLILLSPETLTIEALNIDGKPWAEAIP